MDYSITPLFPLPIGIYNLERKLKKSEKDFIINLERRPNWGNTSSSDGYLLKHKKLKKLKTFFKEAVNHYFKEIYNPKFDVKLRVTQCWANFSEKGSWHHSHEHPNSFISGVFYVNSDSEKDKIIFMKSGYKTIDIPRKDDEWNIYNTESWWFPAVENQLILFPSFLTHKVDPVEADKTRISLSLNTFPVGIVGDCRSMTECLLK
jgi:uncharacterized protein (TIGR02466 family)